MREYSLFPYGVVKTDSLFPLLLDEGVAKDLFERSTTQIQEELGSKVDFWGHMGTVTDSRKADDRIVRPDRMSYQ